MNDEPRHDSHPDIGCLQAIEGLYALLDGEISDPAEARDIEAHVSHCRSCFSRAEMERLLTGRIREQYESGTAGDAEPPERLRKRLQQVLEALE